MTSNIHIYLILIYAFFRCSKGEKIHKIKMKIFLFCAPYVSKWPLTKDHGLVDQRMTKDHIPVRTNSDHEGKSWLVGR